MGRNIDDDLTPLISPDDISEKEKHKKQDEHYSGLSSRFRSHEWRYQYGHLELTFSCKTAHDHLLTVDESLFNPQLIAHLKAFTVMVKSLHSAQQKTQVEVDFFKSAFELSNQNKILFEEDPKDYYRETRKY